MSLKNRIIGLAAVGAAALALTPVAVASPLGSLSVTTDLTTLGAGEPCGVPSSQVFAPWGDDAFYSLVEDGDFESGAHDWSLAGGAKIVRDADDDIVGDRVKDVRALELGEGASATSPAICVGTDSAFYRMFANAVSTRDSANLRVEVLSAGVVVKSDDLTAPTGRSVPTAKLAFVPAALDTLLASLDVTSSVRIRVSSLNGATVRVDGVYMDPRMH